MLRRRILALGWERLPPHCDGIAIRSVGIDALSAAARSSAAGAVLLLGDGALRRSDPAKIDALAPYPLCLLVGLLDLRDDALVTGWAGTVRMTFATRETIAEVLREKMETPLRPAVDPSEWMPMARAAGGRFEEALRVVPGLRRLTVRDWAAALGMRPRTLERLLHRSSVVQPEDVLWAFVLALAAACRRRGDSEETTALVCGYSDRPTLLRAFRRRAVPFPRRGATGRRLSRKATGLSRSATSHPVDRGG